MVSSLKLYDLLEICSRNQYESMNRQRLLEFKSLKSQHVIIVSASLECTGLQKLLTSITPVDFTYEIQSINVSTSNWITIDMIYDQIKINRNNTIVIVPKKTVGSDEDLEKMLHVPIFRGLEDYEQAMCTSNFSIKDITRPIISLIGPPCTDKTLLCRELARIYEIPYISLIELVNIGIAKSDPLAIRANEYLMQHNLIPDYIAAELIRARLSNTDTKAGFIFDGYPKTTADIKWLMEMSVNPNVVINLNLNLKNITKNLRKYFPQNQIKSILEKFHQETQTVINYYSSTSEIIHLDINGLEFSEILSRVSARLDPIFSNKPTIVEPVWEMPELIAAIG